MPATRGVRHVMGSAIVLPRVEVGTTRSGVESTETRDKRRRWIAIRRAREASSGRRLHHVMACVAGRPLVMRRSLFALIVPHSSARTCP